MTKINTLVVRGDKVALIVPFDPNDPEDISRFLTAIKDPAPLVEQIAELEGKVEYWRVRARAAEQAEQDLRQNIKRGGKL